jgi:hypothetical protein
MFRFGYEKYKFEIPAPSALTRIAPFSFSPVITLHRTSHDMLLIYVYSYPRPF